MEFYFLGKESNCWAEDTRCVLARSIGYDVRELRLRWPYGSYGSMVAWFASWSATATFKSFSMIDMWCLECLEYMLDWFFGE